MAVPFCAGMALMKALALTPLRVQQVVFFVVLVTCAVGDAVAIARLADKGWPILWIFVSQGMKLVAFVCLVMFAGAAAIAGYYMVHPNSPMLFGGR